MLPDRIKQHAILAFSVVFLSAITFFTLFPGDDPYRCRALIQTGRWADPPNAKGSRKPFAHWQPDGCIMKKYKSEEMKNCVQKRKLVFGGDSTSRFPMWKAIEMLSSKEFDSSHLPHRGNINTTMEGIELYRDSNPFLHTDFDDRQKLFMKHLSQYKADKALGFELPVEDQKSPALFYLSAGVWYTNPSFFPGLDDDDRTKLYTEAVLNVSEALGPNQGKTFYKEPLDPIDGVGNQMFLLPPHGTNPALKNRRERMVRTAAERAWLADNEDRLNMPIVWANPKMVEGQVDSWNGDGTGFHVCKELNTARINLVFNARCNAKLDRARPHNEGTCCTDYGSKPLIQLLAVSLAILWLLLCLGFSAMSMITSDEPRSGIFGTQAAAFPLVLLMCYFADRTQMMAKGERIYIASSFAAVVFLVICVALSTVRKGSQKEGQYQPINDQLPSWQERPDTFLSRSLIEEWKGWMLLILLAYHWCNPSPKKPVHIVGHILLASYLFETGYSHTLFYLNKGDFGFYRVASMLLRINLLAWGLTFVMNVDYMAYYFSPLISFWYLIVYGIMVIAPHLNDRPGTLIPKIAVSAVLISGILTLSPLIAWSHWAAQLVFNIQFSEETLYYRLTHDMLIVYVGMVIAVVSKHSTPSRLVSPMSILLAAGGVAICLYCEAAARGLNTKTYLKFHNVASFLPILGYLALRNVSETARSHHSAAMAWVGRGSLETYILQAHLLMASTSQGVLLVDGLSGGDANLTGRLGSLIIIVPIFLWVGSAASKATAVLVKALLGDGKLDKTFEDRNLAVKVATTPLVKVGTLLAILWTANLASPAGMKAPPY